MSVRYGIEIIVNADVVKDGVSPGNVYVAQGGVHDLPGATIISDAKTVVYLEPTEFKYRYDKDKPADYQEPKTGGSKGRDLSDFFKPE